MEPERSSAHLAGLQKRFGEGPRVVRVQLEHVDTFETPALNAPLGVTPAFYTHQDGTFYTHRGGLLGAFVGPAGESQLVAVDVLRPRSSVGLFATRRLRNMLAYYESFARPKGRDLELGGGGRAVLSRGSLDLDAEVGLARRWNAEFLANRWQPSLRATLTWWPGRAGPR
jgi:hypothetical protein